MLRSRTAAAYGRNVSTTVSVFSNTQVPPVQIGWLLNQFGALQGPSGRDWTIDVGPSATDVVSVTDGTDDLASMWLAVVMLAVDLIAATQRPLLIKISTQLH